MKNILKMTGVAVMMAGLAAAPSAAFAQSQNDQAASTGNNANAQDQRVDHNVIKSQERGKHHRTQASIRNKSAPTANSSADSSTAYNTTSNVQPKRGDGTDASVHSKPAPAQVH